MNLKQLVEEKNICSLPWLHTEINLQTNNILPCCKYWPPIGKGDDVKKVWYSEEYQTLRNNFIQGIEGPECSACDVGDDVFSYKNFKNKFYMPILNEIDTDNVQMPRMWHFTLKNICNLACRMCSPSSSSLLGQVVEKSIVLKQYYNKHEINNKYDIESLKGSFKDLELLTITGGEPMLDTDCLALVKMVKAEATKVRAINFSSNLSMLNIELLEELSSIDCVTLIGVSMDGSPSVHDYVRHKSDFNELVKNIEYIVTNYPKIKLAFHVSVSALTVGYLPELLDSVNKIQTDLGFNFLHCMVSPVVNRPHLHPSILPASIKENYIKKLESYVNPLTVKDSGLVLTTGINMLKEETVTDINKFIEFTSEFDKVTNTNILDVYPEFNEIFK